MDRTAPSELSPPFSLHIFEPAPHPRPFRPCDQSAAGVGEGGFDGTAHGHVEPGIGHQGADLDVTPLCILPRGTVDMQVEDRARAAIVNRRAIMTHLRE